MSTTRNEPLRFRASQTHHSLISAYQGESQARQQYLTAAERCDQVGLHVAAHAFRFTAAQEKEHAAIFHGLLVAFGGSPILPAAADDVPLPDTPLEILRAVTQSEDDESSKLYPAYARMAEQEGYPRIATAFQRIAETECLHARRFQQYADSLETDALFRSSCRVGWLCLPCGHLHYGTTAPDLCSTCGRTRGHFIRSDFHPFTVSP